MTCAPGQGLEEEAKALVEGLGGRWTRNGGMCRCPAHEDRSPSLSVRLGRSRLLLHCFAGCDPSEILRCLKAARLLDPAPTGADTNVLARGSEPSPRAALRLWGAARAIGGSCAAAYLAERGLHGYPCDLRYHPRTPHGPRPHTRFLPAMIAAVRDATGLVAVHRTFLDGRTHRLARIENARCGLGRFGRGAVRLGGVATRLGLAEGIETALSATALFNLPCWASLGSERFGHVDIPPEVSQLLLFLDNDQGGRRAEALAREAFAYIPSVEARYPCLAGTDWNDVLRASNGAGAVPWTSS